MEISIEYQWAVRKMFIGHKVSYMLLKSVKTEKFQPTYESSVGKVEYFRRNQLLTGMVQGTDHFFPAAKVLSSAKESFPLKF